MDLSVYKNLKPYPKHVRDRIWGNSEKKENKKRPYNKERMRGWWLLNRGELKGLSNEEKAKLYAKARAERITSENKPSISKEVKKEVLNIDKITEFSPVADRRLAAFTSAILFFKTDNDMRDKTCRLFGFKYEDYDVLKNKERMVYNIVAMAKDKVSSEHISMRLNCGKNTVNRWIAVWNSGGATSVRQQMLQRWARA